MMSELDKMRGGELADMSDASIQESFRHTKPLLAKFNHLSIYSDNYRETLNDLIPGIPSSSTIMPPFHCDHGHGIHIGNHVFINAFCTFLDGGSITIGDYTLIGPNVQIYTPHHPTKCADLYSSSSYGLQGAPKSKRILVAGYYRP